MNRFIFIIILVSLSYCGMTQKENCIHLKEINTSKGELSPVLLTENEQIYLVFSSISNNKKAELFKSRISNKNNASTITFGKIERFEKKGLSKKAESCPTFSKEGKQIFLTRTYTAKLTKKILYRNKEADKWGDFRCLPFSCTDTWNTAYPYLIENELYFASDMPGGFGGWDLYVSYYENGTWGSPINLGSNINSEQDEISPFVDDKYQLFFSSNRADGFGGFDIYKSRLTVDQWEIPKNIGKSINTMSNELDYRIYPDLRMGFFSSDRVGGKGSYDIYYWKL